MSSGPPRTILIVGLNYAPEPIGIGPYTSGLAEELVARGHRVHAVVGQPYYPEWKLYPKFKGRWQSSRENGVSITRCPHYIPANPTGTKRLAHHASFASSAMPAVRSARRALNIDMVFTVAPSMIAVPTALRAARRSGVPLWLHIQDFEVGAAFATGLLDDSGRIARAAKAFENRMLHGADVVSTISDPMIDMLLDRGIPQDRIVEIRNWANHAASIEAASGQMLRQKWGLGDKFVAVYSGNIANKQGLEVVVEAARLLSGREDIVFVISGEGPNRPRIEALAAGLTNIRFEDLQPSETVGELLKMADVHLLPQLPEAADLVLPSKLGNMLTSGRPVIATAMPGTGVARELLGSGIVVPPHNAKAIADAIELLHARPLQRAAMGSVASTRAVARWQRNAIIDRFEERMQRLLGGSVHILGQ